MTDDFDQRARAAASRVNEEATALAGDRRPTVSEGSASSPRPPRWLALAAASLVALGTGALLLVTTERQADAPAGTASPSVEPAPNTTDDTPTSPSAPPTVESVAPTTSTPEPAPLTVPHGVPLVAFDDGACLSQFVYWENADGPSPWYAFARGRQLGVAAQVIADPAQGAAGPFAIVLRYLEPSRPTTGQSPTFIDGTEVFVMVHEARDGTGGPGNGEAVWDLPDGSQGYLRARGLDRADIESIVASLEPRPTDHAVPGFDYDTPGTQPERLTMVAEDTNDDVFTDGYGLWCMTDDPAGFAFVTPVLVIADNGIGPYAAAIDRHRPAWIVRQDGAVIVGGVERPVADATPDSLTPISAERWRALWSPNSDTVSRPSLDPDEPVPVRLGAVGDAGENLPTLTLTRLGNGQLHLDLSTTALDPRAATVEVRLDDALVASSSVPVGPVDIDMEASDSDLVTIDIRVLDADGRVVQQSGPTSFPPLIDAP